MTENSIYCFLIAWLSGALLVLSVVRVLQGSPINGSIMMVLAIFGTLSAWRLV